MNTKVWTVISLSLIALIGCSDGGGSTAVTTPSGGITSDSSTATSGQSGAGAAGVLTLDPANGNFGSVKIGVRKGITFMVSNPPTSAISAILSGPDAKQFVVTSGTCFGAVRPSMPLPNPCTIEVLFIATSTGAKVATLDVAGSAKAGLTGTGVSN